MKDHIILIDVSGWTYRHFFGQPNMARSDGTPVNAVHGCVGSLWKIMQQNPSHICAVHDAAKRTFRHDIDPNYKANRPPVKPELAAQFPLIRRAIEAFGVTTLSAPNYEADDLIATLAKRALGQDMHVSIISSDKDLMQLITLDGVTPTVRLIDPLKNKVIGPQEVVEKFGVTPDKLGDVLALMGDVADNILGVPGIGIKGAAALINEFGSLNAAIAAIPNANTYPKPIKKSLSSICLFQDSAVLSRTLVELKRDVPLAFDLDTMRCTTPDSNIVAALLDEFELVTLRDEIFGKVAA